MKRLILSAGARVYSKYDIPTLRDVLYYDILVSVSNEDGTATEAVLIFKCAYLAVGEENAPAFVPLGNVQTDAGFENAQGFHRLTFPQPGAGGAGAVIPKIFAITASQVIPEATTGRPPVPVFQTVAQGRTVVGLTPEPGYYGMDGLPPSNAQFFLGCVKTNS